MEDPNVKKALSQELGDAYNSFVELLHRICTALALCVDDPTLTKTSTEDVVSAQILVATTNRSLIII